MVHSVVHCVVFAKLTYIYTRLHIYNYLAWQWLHRSSFEVYKQHCLNMCFDTFKQYSHNKSCEINVTVMFRSAEFTITVYDREWWRRCNYIAKALFLESAAQLSDRKTLIGQVANGRDSKMWEVACETLPGADVFCFPKVQFASA